MFELRCHSVLETTLLIAVDEPGSVGFAVGFMFQSEAKVVGQIRPSLSHVTCTRVVPFASRTSVSHFAYRQHGSVFQLANNMG